MPSAEEQMDESPERYGVEKLEWGEGIKFWITGGQFPQKQFVEGKVMWSLNTVKRVFIESFKICSTPLLVPSLFVFGLLPYKKKIAFINKVILSFNRLSMGIISPYLLKEKYLSPMAKELQWMIFSFLNEIGVDNKESHDFSKIFSNIINYDTAYYWRVLDLFNETSIDKLKNPRKEIKRLVLINKDRETLSPQVGRKIKMVATGISLLFLHPKINKAFVKVINECDLEMMKPDEADRYWMCFRADYDFFGKTKEQRHEMIKDYSLPEKM